MTDPVTGSAAGYSSSASAQDRRAWMLRVWREVAADWCSHDGVGKSCSTCRSVVSDVADEFIQKAEA